MEKAKGDEYSSNHLTSRWHHHEHYWIGWILSIHTLFMNKTELRSRFQSERMFSEIKTEIM